MNDTAAANAQKANSTAAGATTQTGALQTNGSLPAGFQQDATGRIFKVGSPAAASPVISSTDSASEFDTNKTNLDTKIKNAFGTNPNTAGTMADASAQENAKGNGTATTTGKTGETAAPKYNAEAGRYEDGSLPSAKAQNDSDAAAKAKFEQDAADAKSQYDSWFSGTLANLDATAASTIQGLKDSFDRRINEQRRINDLRIGRTKAYGLGSANALAQPQGFTDAVTIREEQAATDIRSLEGQRDSLIAQAEAAARSGRSDLLRQKMGDIDKIEENLRKNLDSLRDESNRQYENLRQLRKEQEATHEDALQKMRGTLAAIAGNFLGDYEGKTDQEKTDLIQKIMTQTGLSYSEVYAEMEKSSAKAATTKATTDKATAAAAKEKRGEMRSVDGNLYQVTYDENGKATSTLVQQKGAKAPTGKKPVPGKKPTEAEIKRQDAADATEAIESIKGADGYISQDNYATLKKAWVGSGYTAKDFDNRFKIYANPNQPADSAYDFE